MQFADLHDTAQRMKEKGCISDILEWATAREYIYWRLRRRIGELGVCNAIRDASPQLAPAQVCACLWGFLAVLVARLVLVCNEWYLCVDCMRCP